MRLLIVNLTIRMLLKLLCRVRAPGFERVPRRGPLILAVNHINFLEIPVLYLLLRPRPVTAMTKAETWNNPALRILANLWNAIPVRRGAADTNAFRRAQRFLSRGGIVAIAPEGTRSKDGRLRKANAGIITLACRTGAPILPMVHFGGENVWRALRRGRRTIVTVRTGRLIRFSDPATGEGEHAAGVLTRSERERRLDTVMSAMAALLPPGYRGHYARHITPALSEDLDAYIVDHPAERTVVEAFREISGDRLAYSRTRAAGHITGSAFVVNEERTHTLLVHHRSLGIWVQPGGHADGETDLRAVAEKELVEETGLTDYRLVADAIFDLDRHLIPSTVEVPSHYHYDVRYLVIASIHQPIRVSAESVDIRWVPFSGLEGVTGEESILRMVGKARGFRRAPGKLAKQVR